VFQTLAIVAAVLIAALLGFAATKPDTLRIERSAVIQAPPEAIFPRIDDFRAWRAWSPYEQKDPAMQRTLSGATSGKGSVYEWSGDRNVGSGRMEILESTPPSKVVIQLDFATPFEAHNTALFTMEPSGGGATRVTWTMTGPNRYVGKLMSVFFDMDQMVGKDFEAGLAALKSITEKS
jgi:uncharacterized protein YndB with AHSA1/START domain